MFDNDYGFVEFFLLVVMMYGFCVWCFGMTFFITTMSIMSSIIYYAVVWEKVNNEIETANSISNSSKEEL